ncbi:hypothetical protein Ate01nite_33890 [Actinoplanes teichomyceticus]|nr:hypothetical protein Ate01nite_33890 [Actinoplanes teichomyceticus]
MAGAFATDATDAVSALFAVAEARGFRVAGAVAVRLLAVGRGVAVDGLVADGTGATGLDDRSSAGSRSRSPGVLPGAAAAASGTSADRGLGSADARWMSPATVKPVPMTTAVEPATSVYRKRAAAESDTDIHLGESGRGRRPTTMRDPPG